MSKIIILVAAAMESLASPARPGPPREYRLRSMEKPEAPSIVGFSKDRTHPTSPKSQRGKGSKRW